MNKSKRVSIILNLTHSCNLLCGYCYYANNMQSKPGKMSMNLIKHIIKKVSESSFDNFTFSFHGGEPLTLNVEFFQEIIEIQNKFLKGRSFSNSFQTNGTLIENNFISFYKKANNLHDNLNIGISLDGPEYVHNYYRKFRNGNGSHEDILANLNLLSSNHIKYGVLAVCSDVTFKFINDIYPFFKSLKDLSFLDFLCPQDIGHNPILSKGNLSKIMINIFDQWFYDKNCNFEIRFLLSLVSLMIGIGNRILCAFRDNCIANNFMVSIDPFGNVSPCDCMTQINIGNIFDGSFDQFILSNPIRKKYAQIERKRVESYLFCEWYAICRGGCPSNFINTHLVNNFCSDYQEIFMHIRNTLKNFKIIEDKRINYNNLRNVPNPVVKANLVPKKQAI